MRNPNENEYPDLYCTLFFHIIFLSLDAPLPAVHPLVEGSHIVILGDGAADPLPLLLDCAATDGSASQAVFGLGEEEEVRWQVW